LISLEGAPEILEGGFWLFNDEWERLNLFKEPEKEKTLDDITDRYITHSKPINVKEFLYKDNRLIER